MLRIGTCTRTLIAAMIVALPALAVEPGERLADPAQEARARALSVDLRCLVCQNQSIDDSNAPLAKDLRVLVREQIKAGKSDAEVMSYIVARYGDFVLLRPRFTAQTALLWLTPLLILGGVGYGLWRRRETTTARAEAAPLSPDEQRRLNDILRSKT
jgi:cytochrome c-type biogenesis protein CcmH